MKNSEPRPSLAGLAVEIEGVLSQYVVFRNAHQRVAVTWWVLFSHVADRFDFAPYLSVHSAEKRSGKSRLLDVLELLVPRPWKLVMPSEAVVFRNIEATRPTLLFDEIDAIYGPRAREHEGLRALLNVGFQRGTPVFRCVGQSHEVKKFDPFCPKVLAGIGTLPDTVADRSIPIELRRKAPTESALKFRQAKAKARIDPLRESIEAWAADWSPPEHEPETPESLSDRAADCWEPLLVIAECAGTEPARRARQAAVALHSARDDDRSRGEELLADIRNAFEQWGCTRFATNDLLYVLNGPEESPWGDMNAGRGMTPHGLARELRPFGVRPGTIRTESGTTAKGYKREDFEDVWTRYLSREEPKPSQGHVEELPGDGVTDADPPVAEGVRVLAELRRAGVHVRLAPDGFGISTDPKPVAMRRDLHEALIGAREAVRAALRREAQA